MADTKVEATAIDESDAARKERAKAQVSQWQERIRCGLKDDKSRTKQFKRWRRYAAGKIGDDGESGLVRTNLVQSTIQSLLPHIYAQNPEIEARPAQSVDSHRYPQAKKFGRTLEIVINHEFEAAALKPIAKRSVVSAMTTGLGWVKLSYQRDIRTDPIIERRLADTQDNLQRVSALIDELSEDEGTEHLTRQAELEQQIAALKDKVEVTVAEGLALDRLLSEDVLVDPSVRELQDYAQAGWIAHRIWYTPDEAAAAFGIEREKLGKATSYTHRQADEGEHKGDGTPQSYLAAWEVWCRTANTVYTLIEGLDEWAREPWQPDTVGEQWYPFFPLAFAWVDGERYPLSDVEQWCELQDEYNRTRTNFSEHRKRSLPGRVGRRDAISEEDARRITRAEIQELTLIDGAPGEPIQNLIGLAPYAPIDPALYDTSPIRADLELVSGLQDAQRGAVYSAKTATEASIEQSGFATRTSERRDNIEDWIGRMARYAAEMLLQEMPTAAVVRIAGEGAFWPQLSKGELFDMVAVDIRAGSSGKPDFAHEQQAWAQLLPQIVPMVQQVMAAQSQGNSVMADALRAILSETMRRFDMRIDLEEIVPEMQGQPEMPPGMQGPPGMAPGQPPGAPPGQPGQQQQPQPPQGGFSFQQAG